MQRHGVTCAPLYELAICRDGLAGRVLWEALRGGIGEVIVIVILFADNLDERPEIAQIRNHHPLLRSYR